MRFLRPPWLNHGGDKKNAEVYSCDVSSDGKRLATAAGDSHVRIWSTEAIERANDPTYDGPKQLASMCHHMGTIHAVRFSKNCKYLASGADDKLVCIYQYDPSTPSHAAAFGTNEPAPVENWRMFRRLNGHDNDVQDIGWSYDSSILVTVGLDSKVVVWSGYTFERLKTISIHQSHVKGITFDPANKYFATASDDRTIKIFRFTSPKPTDGANDHTNNFVVEKSISWASQGSPLTTYFRRLSWSPDGNLIAAANSVNGPVASVAIITRGSWEPGTQSVHLIGHEAPVEVCAFSPRLFTKQPFDSEKSSENPLAHAITVIACAGQDKTLTLWSTVDARPLLIATELCEKSFSDLGWMPDGQGLFATSLDGTIMYIRFGDGELGYSLPTTLNEQSLAKYGAGRKGAGIVEGPAELRLEERSKEGDMRDVQDRMGAIMGDGATQEGQALITSTQPNGTNGTTPQTNGADASAAPAPAPPPPEPSKADKIKSRVTITKDGKKRVAPLLVSSSHTTQSSLPQTALRSAGAGNRGAAEEDLRSVLDLSKPVDALPRGGLAAVLLGNKRRLAAIEGDEDNLAEKRVALAGRDGSIPILKNTPAGLTLPRPQKSVENAVVPEFIRPAVVNPSLVTSSVRLAVPKVRDRFIQPFGKRANKGAPGAGEIQPDEGENAGMFMEAQNPTGPSPTGRAGERRPSRIIVTKNETVKWYDYLPKSILLLANGDNFWAAGCEDGSIYSWSLQGRRLLNAMILESQPIILEANGQWLLCVTAVGQCYVWNMTTLSAPHPPVSLAPVLDIAASFMTDHARPAPSVTSGHVNSQGRIFVTVSSGDGYSYSPSMFTWQRLTEPWWAVISQYWNSREDAVRDLAPNGKGSSISRKISEGVLAYLERQTTVEATARGRAVFLQRLLRALLPLEGYENLEASISIAHLENRIAAALQIGAKEDFHIYLVMYAKRLGAEGQKGKVEELLADLARGVFDDDVEIVSERSDTGVVTALNRDLRAPHKTVCGVPKEKLLRDCVLVLGKYRELSRIIMPYDKLTRVVEDGTGEDPDAMPVE